MPITSGCSAASGSVSERLIPSTWTARLASYFAGSVAEPARDRPFGFDVGMESVYDTYRVATAAASKRVWGSADSYFV